MYFCPNCSYLFDISKSSNIQKNESVKTPITKFNDVLIKLEDKIDLSKFKAEFDKDEMIKNKKYQKLSTDDKNKINVLFEEDLSSGAEFKCNNCNFTKPIINTTLLYQINLEDKITKIKNLEENELLSKDPLLPHTHDYTCKNPSCLTHKNIKLKDSVFYKEKNSYKVNYICCVCFYNW